MEIVNVYREAAPPSRFIGKRYTDMDRAGGSFGAKWDEWHQHGWFALLEGLAPPEWAGTFPEAQSYIGLMRWDGGGAMEYWIGLFLPPGTGAPEGFLSIDYPATDLGVCWLKGRMPEIFSREEECLDRMKAEGFTLRQGAHGPEMVAERYQSPRFTEEDARGNVILDIVAAIEPELGADTAGRQYCDRDFLAFEGETCPECKRPGAPLQPDDPIFIGELPGPLRNALQIAFSARDIPFTALPHMGSGFTMAAGDLLETWRVYVPFERSAEADSALGGLLTGWRTGGAPSPNEPRG